MYYLYVFIVVCVCVFFELVFVLFMFLVTMTKRRLSPPDERGIEEEVLSLIDPPMREEVINRFESH